MEITSGHTVSCFVREDLLLTLIHILAGQTGPDLKRPTFEMTKKLFFVHVKLFSGFEMIIFSQFSQFKVAPSCHLGTYARKKCTKIYAQEVDKNISRKFQNKQNDFFRSLSASVKIGRLDERS